MGPTSIQLGQCDLLLSRAEHYQTSWKIILLLSLSLWLFNLNISFINCNSVETCVKDWSELNKIRPYSSANLWILHNSKPTIFKMGTKVLAVFTSMLVTLLTNLYLFFHIFLFLKLCKQFSVFVKGKVHSHQFEIKLQGIVTQKYIWEIAKWIMKTWLASTRGHPHTNDRGE